MSRAVPAAEESAALRLNPFPLIDPPGTAIYNGRALGAVIVNSSGSGSSSTLITGAFGAHTPSCIAHEHDRLGLFACELLCYQARDRFSRRVTDVFLPMTARHMETTATADSRIRGWRQFSLQKHRYANRSTTSGLV